MKTDTDGIVYLRWPRLDFQSLTCCNPHSVRSASRVAQTSHWCFCSIARPAAPIPPPSPYLAWQEASTASGGWKRQPLTRGPTHHQTALQERSSRLIATTDFVFLNPRTHRHFAQIFTRGIHFKPWLGGSAC